ncbi:hypothetical protein DTW90_24075 [Neorhizobium sp. P12A]|jgi:hypothetical protein|uniref:bestrophin-like domain n=1 Tax=Rhizobium/Agrobacterium group TaxID=227290 RepID=UPI00104ED283|nr:MULTISPECIES: hypothetical protein [Rhizobium/Agrobacterium group]KAA0694404.1 hypothetical protein DTW90_24075 [Neorhizobium sp. P12A]TCR85459.1 hypothetical protein EV561_107231 [Rhizobium sp. BK376]
MELAVNLAERSELAFAILLLASQLIAHEIGYRIGYQIRVRAAGQAESVGVVVGGMLALLAFVLALTLSYSTARFNERRHGTLTEANAIGTAWLRAKAIGTPQAEEIAQLLEDYAKVREDFVREGRDKTVMAQTNQQTTDLQKSIWSRVSSLVRERPDPVSAALMSSVNETFDAGTAERFALGIRLPRQIFWLLVGVMHLSMAALGYQFGLRGKPVRLLIVLLTIVWTAVVVNILDLASARVGSFRTDTSVYDWTLQTFKGFESTGAN